MTIFTKIELPELGNVADKYGEFTWFKRDFTHLTNIAFKDSGEAMLDPTQVKSLREAIYNAASITPARSESFCHELVRLGLRAPRAAFNQSFLHHVDFHADVSKEPGNITFNLFKPDKWQYPELRSLKRFWGEANAVLVINTRREQDYFREDMSYRLAGGIICIRPSL